MTRVLVDTNVVLDVLLARRPHLAESAAILVAAETGRMRGMLAAHSLPTIYYFIRKDRGHAQAKVALGRLMTLFEIVSVNASVLTEALLFELADYEDALVAAAAQRARCACIVTRDVRGFRGSPVRAVSPEVFLASLA